MRMEREGARAKEILIKLLCICERHRGEHVEEGENIKYKGENKRKKVERRAEIDR